MNGPTPGEWIIHPSNPELVIWKRTGQVIADCDQDPAHEQRVANARLCAAAPDMLAACREAVEAIFNVLPHHRQRGCLCSPSGQERPCTPCLLNAAISKAEGKS